MSPAQPASLPALRWPDASACAPLVAAAAGPLLRIT